MVMLGSVYVPIPGWLVDQWDPPIGRYRGIIVTTSPDSRPSVSPGHPISVRGVSGIRFLLWLLMKWANQGRTELDYVCVLSRGLMKREVQCLRRGSRRDSTHRIIELVV